MKIFHGIPEVPLSKTAVAIGVFDGVHLGHQSILRHASGFYGRAHDSGILSAGIETSALQQKPLDDLSPLALTFDIHPMHLIAPERAPGSVSTLEQRYNFIQHYGGAIQSVVVAHFDHQFAALTPDEFVKDILVHHLGASHIYVGTDFRYGHFRKGTIHTLIEAGHKYGFCVTVVPPVNLRGDRISSSRIRQAIGLGEIESVREMLGHEYKIAGTVVHGKQLGRKLGFPTANIHLDDPSQLLPSDGVYGGYAVLPNNGAFRVIRSAISVGTNPTTDTEGVRKVEAYLMDGFDEDIYDMHLEIDIRYRLRGQATFINLDDLIYQIKDDVNRIQTELPLL